MVRQLLVCKTFVTFVCRWTVKWFSWVSVSFTCRRVVCQVDSPHVLPQPLQLLLLLLVLSLCLMNRTLVKTWNRRTDRWKTEHTHTLTSCLRSRSYSGRYSLKEEEKGFSLSHKQTHKVTSRAVTSHAHLSYSLAASSTWANSSSSPLPVTAETPTTYRRRQYRTVMSLILDSIELLKFSLVLHINQPEKAGKTTIQPMCSIKVTKILHRKLQQI